MKKLFSFLTLLLITAYTSNAQIITTFAGNGAGGYSGDGVAATATELNSLYGAWVDDVFGAVYIGDAGNNRIRAVNSSGIISTIAGTGTPGYSGDGGPATAAELNFPLSVALDPAGNVYICDYNNHRVREIKNSDGGPSGFIFTIAGTGTAGYSGDGGQATAAQIYHPQGIYVDASYNVYFGDEFNHRVRMISPSGIISTVAGDGVPGFTGDGVAATATGLYYPCGVFTDKTGNIYVCDYYDQRIRMVNTSGIISTVAGDGTSGFSGDGGPATLAELKYPKDVFLDTFGNIYISDADNNRVRMVDHATGNITTIAGTGSPGYCCDGGPATLAELYEVQGIYVTPSGDIYLGDVDNNRVRLISGPPTTTTTTGVTNVTNAQRINVYPNPAMNTLNIVATVPVNNVIITDLFGQMVYQQSFSAEQVQIDIASLSSGLYFVKINHTEVTKFVKQ